MIDLKNRWKHNCGCVCNQGEEKGHWVIVQRCEEHSINTEKRKKKMERIKRKNA